MKIEIKFESDWEEIEAITSSISKNEVLHNNLKTADTLFNFTAVPNLELYNNLRGIGISEVPIKVTVNDTPYFYGYVRKNFNITKIQSLQPLKIECVSPSFLLKRKIKQQLNYSNTTVSTLISNILTAAGITSFALPTINFIIPGFTTDENTTYHSYIEQLLFEYGYVFSFDESGSFKTYNLFPSSIATTKLFNGLNSLRRIDQIKNEEGKEKVIVEWKTIATYTNKVVFSDTTGSQLGYKCYIELPPNGYLGGKEEWFAEFDIEEGEVLSTTSITLDINKDPDISVLIFQQSGNRARVSVKNTNSSVSKFIRKFDIIAGSVTVEKDINKSIVTKNPLTEKIETIKTQYIFDIDSANYLCNGLAWWYKYNDFKYKVTSKTNYVLNDIVTVSDNGIGTNIARIITKKSSWQDGIFEYELEAVDEFIEDVPEEEYSVQTPVPIDMSNFLTYYIDSNTTIVKTFDDGTFLPDEVVFNLYGKVGIESPIAYNGIFKIYVSDVLQYTSAAPESQLVIDGDNYLDFGFSNPPLDIQIMRVEFWDAATTNKLDVLGLSFIKDAPVDIDEIVSEVEQNKPRYLGMFLDENPTVFKVGDWFIVYGEDDTPIERGIYKVKADLTFLRIEGQSVEDNDYIISAMPDLLAITNSGDYGEMLDYGSITFISNIASNSLFTSTLRVGIDNFNSTLIEGGKIKANVIDVDTILGEDATFTGTVDCHSGIFRGSIEAGPLELNMSTPAAQSFTTTSKTLRTFMNELAAAGIAAGSYPATGTYNGTAIGKITLTKTGPVQSTIGTATSRTLFVHYPANDPNAWYYSVGSWAKYRYTETYNIIIYGTDLTTVLYTSGGTKTYYPSSAWENTGYYYVGPGGWQSTIAAPTGTTAGLEESPLATTMATGSPSFNAGSYTYRLLNLPSYTANLPAGTVYLVASGSNYQLFVKG